jgi:hypothetical protein
VQFRRLFLTVLLLLVLASCQDQVSRTPAIGEVFTGPSTLPLRKDLSPKSAITATAKHGDRLEVLEYKRRFVRVRTAEGREGWTDLHLLLTPEQMAELRTQAQKAAGFPSQGIASVYEPLNLHAEPNRTSPSILQIPENGKVEVVGHLLTPRAQGVSESNPPIRLVKPRAPRRSRKDKQANGNKLPPPAPPPPPGVPQNWQALSLPNTKSLAAAEAARAVAPSTKHGEKQALPVAMDDWSLVRMKDGNVGWALTRMLSMSIPDDVAQYAEGHRITSYFPLAQVRDGDETHTEWLWTTIDKGGKPYEYDSFRVFIWSRGHHRYESALVKHDVVGHYPVLVDTSGSEPRFSLVLEGTDDQLYRESYILDGNRVRFADREPANQPPPAPPNSVAQAQPRPTAAPGQPASWFARLKQKWFR